MKTSASYFLLTIIALQAADIYAQQTQKPSPTFTLSIAEDRNASATQPGLDRVLVKLTHIGPGVELEKFHPEAVGMYNMIVLRDGRPAKETSALKALRNYRKADPYPHYRQSQSTQARRKLDHANRHKRLFRHDNPGQLSGHNYPRIHTNESGLQHLGQFQHHHHRRPQFVRRRAAKSNGKAETAIHPRH